MPSFKPVEFLGSSLDDLRVRDNTGSFRVIYIAKLAGVVYVIHCFQKKTGKTSKVDIDLASTRYRDLLRELKT